MLYKGKPIETVRIREVFGKRVAWIRILEDDTFLQVAYDEIQNEENPLQ